MIKERSISAKTGINGLAVRRPKANVSLGDVTVNVQQRGLNVGIVNDALVQTARHSLKNVMGFTGLPLVSGDFNGSSLSSIVDGSATYVQNRQVKVLSWYINETGYSSRMIDLIKKIGALM